jgi:hypothetical protein
MEEKIVTVNTPIALRQLITTSNELLKNYQTKLLQEIEDANIQMMQILKLDPALGWRLDMERMIYVRPQPEEEAEVTQTESKSPSTGKRSEK